MNNWKRKGVFLFFSFDQLLLLLSWQWNSFRKDYSKYKKQEILLINDTWKHDNFVM